MTLLAKAARRRPADLLLAAEAFLLLTIFRICLTLVPVGTILRAIARGRVSDPTPEPPLPDRTLTQALRIRWAVEAVTRNAATPFVCFPQTLAGYTMLRLRGISSAMVYGVAHTPDPEAKLIAHTWLTVGDRIVLGGEGSAAFTPLDRWS